MRPVTVHDVIVRALGTGQYLETAVGMADVGLTTVRDWLREGARLSDMLHNGHVKLRQLSHHQRDMVTFSREAIVALSESEARGNASIGAAGQLPMVTRRETTITKMNGAGVVLSQVTTVQVETAPADWRAEAWRMERRFNKRWGAAPPIEETGLEDHPQTIAARAEELRQRIHEVREGKVIELPVGRNGAGSG